MAMPSHLAKVEALLAHRLKLGRDRIEERLVASAEEHESPSGGRAWVGSGLRVRGYGWSYGWGEGEVYEIGLGHKL